MKNTFIILILWAILQNVNCCDCTVDVPLDTIRKFEIEDATCIIYGNVIFVDSSKVSCRAIVLETYKGELEHGDTIQIFNPVFCEPTIDSLGRWIIYSSISKFEDNFSVNACGLTRSENHPESNERFWYYTPPPRRPIDSVTCESQDYNGEIDKAMIKRKERAHLEFKEELELLRNGWSTF